MKKKLTELKGELDNRLKQKQMETSVPHFQQQKEPDRRPIRKRDLNTID